MAVVAIPELGDRLAHFFEVAEEAAVDGLLLQRAIEALGATPLVCGTATAVSEPPVYCASRSPARKPCPLNVRRTVSVLLVS